MGAARTWHVSVLLPDGRVLAAGGDDSGACGSTGVLPTSELWDPATGEWTPSGNLVTARCQHSGTLLRDGRVLVVGGQDASAFLASAELWDPATGKWSAAETMAGPRAAHTATMLADGRVLVAGGADGATADDLATAEIYDPAFDTWAGTGSLGQARNLHAAARLSDGRVLVAGGSSGSTTLTSAEVWSPSPAPGEWSLTGSFVSARRFHTATLLPDGTVLAAGGQGASGPLQSVERWDPAGDAGAGAWTASGSLTTERQFHSASLLPDGRVLAAGGMDSGSAFVTSTEIWNAGTWSAGAALGTGRQLHSAVLLPDGRVLAVGGENGGGPIAGSELWTRDGDAWSPGPAMSTARTAHKGVLLPELPARVIVTGGEVGSTTLGTCEIWTADSGSGSWSATGSLATARKDHSITLLPEGRILAVAGQGASGLLASAEVWNPASGANGEWGATGGMTDARWLHRDTLLADGRVMISGGASGTALSAPGMASVEIWDPAANGGAGAFAAGPSLATKRNRHTATLLADGRVLVTGGADGTILLRSVEIWDPALNAWTAGASLSSQRADHRALLLPDGRVLVMGGTSSALGNTASTEVWDPRTGAWTSAGNMRVARSIFPPFVFPDGRVLVAGGASAANTSTGLVDLWDPAVGAWTAAQSLGTERFNHTGTFLPDHRVLVTGGKLDTVEQSSTEIWRVAPALPPGDPCLGGFGLQGAGLPPDPWPAGSTIPANGRRLTGCSEASGGGTNQSAGGVPVVRFSSLSNGSVWNGRLTGARNWSADGASFTVPGDAGSPPGYYLLDVSVNGVPSPSRVVRIGRTYDKYYLHRESTLGGATRDLLALSPATSGHGTVRTPLLCQPFSTVGEFLVQRVCSTTTDTGENVFPAGGFAESRGISGAWTLRADVRGAGSAGGTAYLFARVKRHSDGSLIHETERLASLDLGAMGTAFQEAVLQTVVRPRASDGPACPSATIPCASTMLAAGDRVRLEWWVEVVATSSTRSLELALEAPGSTAGAFPQLTSETLGATPLGTLVSGLAARWVDGTRRAAEISWQLEPGAAVVHLRVLAGERELESIDVEPSTGFESSFSVKDASPGAAPAYFVEAIRTDGSIERFGPVSPASDEKRRFGCGGGALPAPGVSVIAVLALLAAGARVQLRAPRP